MGTMHTIGFAIAAFFFLAAVIMTAVLLISNKKENKPAQALPGVRAAQQVAQQRKQSQFSFEEQPLTRADIRRQAQERATVAPPKHAESNFTKSEDEVSW